MTKLEYHLSVKSDERDSNVSLIAIDRNLPEEELPQGLEISFERTIRVPDNEELSKLPPSLGSFPLYKVQDYAHRLPQSIVDKGGVFFPMHQREAMWINFKASVPFMIKIYCGGVNVVSGEHAAEGAETKQRRAKLLEQGKLIQDYVVVPEQPWLDGVAVKPSVVRQFVAMPLSQGYTVEAQLSGKEVVGGLMFEITPALREPKDTLQIFHRTLTGKTIAVRCFPDDQIHTIKSCLHDTEGIPIDQQRLINAGRTLEDHETLSHYNIKEGDILHMVLRLRGGSSNPLPMPILLKSQGGSSSTMPSELGVAVGGLINQDVRKDTRDPLEWIRGLTMAIPVQILDSSTFFQVTGQKPPIGPIDAETVRPPETFTTSSVLYAWELYATTGKADLSFQYAKAGLPFFDLHEEKSTDVSGAEAFGALQSVNEIDMARGQADGHEPAVHPRATKLYGSSLWITAWSDGDVFHIEDPDGLLSPSGPHREFRTLPDLEAEIKDFKLENEGDEMVG